MSSKNYWLMKSEPETFSIDDLARDKTTKWEGVRNYQARNYMTNDMSPGDLVLFYHSNATPPGIAGIMQITTRAFPDATQFDKKSELFDPKSTKETPRWHCVEGAFVEKFAKLISLDKLKAIPALQDMVVLRKGNRLSITPVSAKEFSTVTAFAKRNMV